MKPALVIMAAGMGSRYGGLKQIDPVDAEGNKIIDFSIFDAVRAGFGRVVFIIKRENEKDFRQCIGDRLKDKIPVEYVYQELTNIPDGYSVPEGRVKPFGTAHAILSCIDTINEPFAVINADDFYGPMAFKLISEFLTTHEDDDKYRFAMVGYELKNTLTDNGYVSRGVCEIDDNGHLQGLTERTHIEKRADGAAYTEDDGNTWVPLTGNETVSMNLWGFSAGIMKELKKAFAEFMEKELPENPLKAECYLPFVVDDLLKAGAATVEVLTSKDRWFGVTYKEDKPFVMESIQKLKDDGVYTQKLW